MLIEAAEDTAEAMKSKITQKEITCSPVDLTSPIPYRIPHTHHSTPASSLEPSRASTLDIGPAVRDKCTCLPMTSDFKAAVRLTGIIPPSASTSRGLRIVTRTKNHTGNLYELSRMSTMAEDGQMISEAPIDRDIPHDPGIFTESCKGDIFNTSLFFFQECVFSKVLSSLKNPQSLALHHILWKIQANVI